MVLNGKADRYRISAATRQRVEAVIAQSGYQPNRLARNMRLGRSTLVGLILAEGTQDVGDLLAGLEPLLAGAGYNLVVATVSTNPAFARERIQRLNHDGLAGLIYGPGFPVGVTPVLAGLGPTLILGLPAAGLPGVFHDDEPVGQIRPAGMQRSERRRGQAAGEQLLSMLTGAPPGNRRVPLTPVESELLSSRVAELLREDDRRPALSAQLRPASKPEIPTPATLKPDNSATQQPATEAEPPVPIPVPPRRPEPIIPAPVVEAPVVTGVPPVSATSPEEIPTPADPVPPVVVTPEPEPPLVIQETLTPAIETAASVAPSLVPEPVIATPATPTPNNSATQQPTTEAEPPTPPPPTPEIVPPVIVIPVVETPTGAVSEAPVSSEIVSEPELVADSAPVELKPEPEVP
jgi:hypothetical protein